MRTPKSAQAGVWVQSALIVHRSSAYLVCHRMGCAGV
jgi:hypothetical protein